MTTIKQLESTPGVTIVYDGECPMCRTYASLLRLRQAAGQVTMINARDDLTLVQSFADAGYSLDEGMAAFYGSRMYYGSDAVTMLSSLASRSGLLNRTLAELLASPERARLLYPVMKAVRASALFLLGRPSIDAALSQRASGNK